MSHAFSSPAQLENERLAAFIKQAAPGMPIVCWGKDHWGLRGWLHEEHHSITACMQGPTPLVLSRLSHSLLLCLGALAGQVRRGGVPGKHYHYGLVSLPKCSRYTRVSYRDAALTEVLHPSSFSFLLDFTL